MFNAHQMSPELVLWLRKVDRGFFPPARLIQHRVVSGEVLARTDNSGAEVGGGNYIFFFSIEATLRVRSAR